jgi:hypothetical protein
LIEDYSLPGYMVFESGKKMLYNSETGTPQDFAGTLHSLDRDHARIASF